MAAGWLCQLGGCPVWVSDFICWYNNEYRHSRIRFVTPSERHRGLGHQILACRHELYRRAKQKTPHHALIYESQDLMRALVPVHPHLPSGLIALNSAIRGEIMN
jgi:hypothetical protein